METIEERARTAQIRSSVVPLTIASAHTVGYIQGATEQRAIDKEQLRIVLNIALPNIEYITELSPLRRNKRKFIDDVIKAMEK